VTSKKQTPKSDWLNFVITGRARTKIKSSLREEKRQIAADGKEMLRRKFASINVNFLSVNITALEKHFKLDSATELYYQVAKGKIELKKLKQFTIENGRFVFEKLAPESKNKQEKEYIAPIPGKKDTLLIGDEKQQLDYELAHCCSPISGDDVFGFITVNGKIKIHRENCPNATQMMSNYAYRVIQARWASKELMRFEVQLGFTGIDDIGLVHSVTNIISSAMNVDMKAISFESNDGIFKGMVKVLVHDTEHLTDLTEKLLEVKGVHQVDRIRKESLNTDL